jgi:hypothetical protein
LPQIGSQTKLGFPKACCIINHGRLADAYPAFLSTNNCFRNSCNCKLITAEIPSPVVLFYRGEFAALGYGILIALNRKRLKVIEKKDLITLSFSEQLIFPSINSFF